MTMTSKYKWFKAADSTEWVRMPMEEVIPLLIKPKLTPQAEEKPPVDPEPEKVHWMDQYLKAAELDPRAAEKAAETDRIWNEYYKKREAEKAAEIERLRNKWNQKGPRDAQQKS